MATKQNKPKNKDRLATEERLLSAAEQVIAKYGFDGATTRMIAKKADVNIALITRYFGGKYGLMVKLVERKADNRFIELPYPVQESLTEECILFTQHRINTFLEDIVIFKIILVQFLVDAKFLKRFQENLEIFERHPEFEKRLSNLISSKKISQNVEPFQILNTLENFIFGIIVGRQLIRQEDEVNWGEIEHFVRSYCSAFERS